MHDDLVRDIYERLGGIEAKLDDVRAIRNTADAAQLVAKEALLKAESNGRDIEKLESTLKWAIGIIIPVVLFILGYIFI
ncbi:hemolysin XhlA family protein [Sporosarcina koreensis]|uniref:hemolysin XhlA family protein n=1 Tax=Sporosarcina koreensis TaxID=334735 RepID=UPI0007573A7D|nr:hemolysin XhlA family protein [Sporosarcina koreensis]